MFRAIRNDALKNANNTAVSRIIMNVLSFYAGRRNRWHPFWFPAEER